MKKENSSPKLKAGEKRRKDTAKLGAKSCRKEWAVQNLHYHIGERVPELPGLYKVLDRGGVQGLVLAVPLSTLMHSTSK